MPLSMAELPATRVKLDGFGGFFQGAEGGLGGEAVIGVVARAGDISDLRGKGGLKAESEGEEAVDYFHGGGEW